MTKNILEQWVKQKVRPGTKLWDFLGNSQRAYFRWLRNLRRIGIWLGFYRFAYAWSYFKYILNRINKLLFNKTTDSDEITCDLALVIAVEGWILEAICREIADYYPGKYKFCTGGATLVSAKSYFFSHYSDLASAFKKNPFLWGRNVFALYTHPSNYHEISDAEFRYLFNRIDNLICMNSASMKELAKQGIKEEKLSYVIGAADPKIFQPHERSNGVIGFSAQYLPRKCPDLIFDIIVAMPQRDFILLGKRWEQFQRFSEMQALPNFQYIDAPWTDYPRYYNAMDVFVSAAEMEGGPIPLIEAMMCNVVPVARRTGFAPDIIDHGQNGFLFEKHTPLEEICALIEKAYALKSDVRSTVEHLTWKRYSDEVQKIMEACSLRDNNL